MIPKMFEKTIRAETIKMKDAAMIRKKEEDRVFSR